MKNLFQAGGITIVFSLSFICLLFVVQGCPSLGKAQHPIDAGNVAPLWTIVLERYDVYVVNDTTVTDLERLALQLDSTLLTKILEKALND